MFGLEKKIGFIAGLAASRAGQFSGAVRDVLGPAASYLKAAPETEQSSIGTRLQAPEMILAESGDDLGRQAEEDPFAWPPRRQNDTPAIKPQEPDDTRFGSASAPLDDDRIQNMRKTTRAPQFSAKELMKKKLNPFQIEQVAETIKERMERESKILKERRGEEP